MSKEQFASVGISAADPSIPWPKRGTGGRELTDRAGWERRTIPVLMAGEAGEIEAMCRGELAANVMAEGEGFAISLASCGLRLSYGGRVFARCDDAMVAAEAMMMCKEPWESVRASGRYTPFQAEFLRGIMEAAERCGQILLDQVFPT